LGNLAFLDTLIDQASACNYSKAWLKRLSKLRLLRACTEGDWTLVYDTLMVQVKTDSSPKNSKSANQLTTLTLSTETELILHGLSHSEPYSQMTEEDHASQAALDVMNALKAIFQVEIPNHARGKNAQTTPKLVSVWRTDFKSVRLLGAVLERSQLFSETLPFYEALEKIQPEYASRRWLACKLRQAEHSYKLRDYYQGRMSSSADSQRRQEYERKYREAEDRAEKYQNVARSQKRKLKLESYEDISAYPELLNLTDIIKTILKMDEPGKPTLPDATTAPVESANSLPPELEHSVTASPDEADTTADPDAVTLMTSPDPAQTEADNVEPAPADTGHDIVLATYTEPTDTDTAHENMCQPVLNSNSIKPSDSPDTLTKDSSVFNEEATLVADTSQTDTIVIDRASMADDITILHPEANKSVASVTRLPTTILYLLDYRLLIIRASCRLNIEHQLTGESVSVWLKNGRISGDWIIPNGLTTDAQLLSGTCLWIQRIADTTDCIISIPEQGIALRLNCG
jgi:hypothetical protein